MKQKVLTTTAAALHAVDNAIGGATEHGAAIGIKQNDAASLTAKKEALLAADSALTAARVELRARKRDLTEAVSTSIAFVTLTRDTLKARLGTSYSTAWDVTGFVGTLKLPRNIAQILFKLQKLSIFLTANPDAQIAACNITAAQAQLLFDDLAAKQNALNAQKTVEGNAVIARKAALKTVTRAISNLVSELKGLVEPQDMVYLSFGLNRPGATATPDVPENVTAEVVLNDAAKVKWPPAPRADHYRVWKRVKDVDQNWVPVGSSTDPNFMMEGLPANSAIEVAVSAVSDGGESQRSVPITIQT